MSIVHMDVGDRKAGSRSRAARTARTAGVVVCTIAAWRYSAGSFTSVSTGRSMTSIGPQQVSATTLPAAVCDPRGCGRKAASKRHRTPIVRFSALRRLVGFTPEDGDRKGRPPPSFDASAWLENFQRERAGGGDVRDLRLEVQQGTLDALNAGRYIANTGKVVTLPIAEMMRGLQEATNYDEDTLGESAAPAVEEKHVPMKIRVRNIDCLVAAEEALQAENVSRVAVLNMANEYSPGGDWQGGCGAQEENLHRRTNLCDHVSNFRQLMNAPPVSYPLAEFGGAVSPKVCVLRGPEADGYPFLAEPKLIHVLSAAAYCRPRCSGGRLEEYFEDGMRRKIKAMLRAARGHRVDHLILSAFGCGAFANPPLHVAELFRECLLDDEFNGSFQTVEFAIIEDSNSGGRRHGSDLVGNVAPFAHTFEDLQ